jgi:hypothetical protein
MPILSPGPREGSFAIDFGRVRRPGTGLWKRLVGGTDAIVDGYAIAQAVLEAMERCPNLSPMGKAQPWNEFRVFLSREDHDALRELEGSLAEQVLPLLEQRRLEREAEPVGNFAIRLLVDDADSIARGQGVLDPRHARRISSTEPAQGEITIRADKTGSSRGASTRRVAGAKLTTPGGSVDIPVGVRVVLGRVSQGPNHVALPGADDSISRAHAWVVVGADSIEVGRMAGANPLSVEGTSLADGATTKANLPVELVFSRELRARVTT